MRLQDRSRLSREARGPRWGAQERIASPSSSFEDKLRAVRAFFGRKARGFQRRGRAGGWEVSNSSRCHTVY